VAHSLDTGSPLSLLLFSRGRAQDLCQETYLYALEHIKTLKEPLGFPKWLFLIAKNRFIDFKRSPKNKPHDSLNDSSLGSVLQNPADTELAFQIQEALNVLKPQDRIVLLVVDIEGYSYTEAAEIIKISESAVRSRLHRAREAFAQKFIKK
jgi:RNA polymerase sigma-70 factor (ECF subfamily)